MNCSLSLLLVILLFVGSTAGAAMAPSSRLMAIVADRYEYTDADTSDAPVSTPSEDEPTVGLQFMITQRMRRVLEDELGYLTEEVDVMEPQVAAVVIERGLARPSTGMPKSWMRPEPIKPFGDSLKSSLKSLISKLNDRIKSLKKHVLPTLKTVAPFAAAILLITNFDSVISLVSIIGGSIKNLAPKSLPKLPKFEQKSTFSGTGLNSAGRKRRETQPKAAKKRVDITALERVARPLSWPENASITATSVYRGMLGK